MSEHQHDQFADDPDIAGEPDVMDDAGLDTSEADHTPEPTYSDEDADEARQFGWKSPDEWKGEKPSGYIDDPLRYMERLENSRPFKTIKDRMEQKEREAEERIRKLEAVTKSSLERQKAQHRAEVEAIRAAKRQAVTEGDVEAYEQLERREQGLAPVEAPQEAQQRPQVDPYVQQYVASDEGSWTRNPVLQEQGARLISAAGLDNAPPADQLEYAKAELKKLYPGAFPQDPAPQPKAQQRPRVDGGSLAIGGKSAGGFAKIPSEAREAFKAMVKQGIYQDNDADRKAYADEYNRA